VHVSCLLALYEHEEGLTGTELAAVCGVDRAQVSRVAAELTGMGLICEAAPGPRRRYRGALTLTEEGRAAAAEMSDIVDEKLQRVSGDIPREDIAAFYRVLSTIVERLEAL
jgi:DNA-binding MarR family transcriptional regulator